MVNPKMLSEIEFLKAMMRDLEHHLNQIKRRIKQLEAKDD